MNRGRTRSRGARLMQEFIYCSDRIILVCPSVLQAKSVLGTRRSIFLGVSRCLTRFDPEDRKSRRLSVEVKQFALLVSSSYLRPRPGVCQPDVYRYHWWLLGWVGWVCTSRVPGPYRASVAS
jgi:hypothetical protein